jgi:hypothetical protein
MTRNSLKNIEKATDVSCRNSGKIADPPKMGKL